MRRKRSCIKVSSLRFCVISVFYNAFAEEELKRLQQKSNEFQYTYDVPKSDALKTEGPLPREEVEETPFVPPPLLDVPADITIVSVNMFFMFLFLSRAFVAENREGKCPY